MKIMPNSSYTYAQVLAGTGYYQQESTPAFSSGVQTMQQRLIACGYNLGSAGADGKFGSGTNSVVRDFQLECYLAVDGKAGKQTLKQLDSVYQSSYFKTYGKPITKNQWGQDYILNSVGKDIDILARVIWVEDHSDLDAQYAVAKVIKNRSISGNSDYLAPEASERSIWVRVIGKKDPIQYSSASKDSVGGTAALKPYRGRETHAACIDVFWRTAVDLATKLVNGTAFTVPNGYAITGNQSSSTISTTKNGVVSNQLYQGTYTVYKGSPKAKNGVVFDSNSAERTAVFNKSQ